MCERDRIEFVTARYGPEEARRWARRTAAIYRSAVLDPRHFAHEGARRRQFIEAYLELKRFAHRQDGRQDGPRNAGRTA